MDLVEPLVPVDAVDARLFPCTKGALVRSPRETKGQNYDVTTEASPIVCTPGGDCC
jgi:hypothetical protein